MGVMRRGRLGGRQELTGNAGTQIGIHQGWKELLRLVQNTVGDPVTREGGDMDSDTHTLFSAYVINTEGDGGPLDPPPRVLLKVRVGDGNDDGAGAVEYILPAGKPLTLSGSEIHVFAQLFNDELGTVQALTTTKAFVEAFITIGDGSDVEATSWVRPAPPLASQAQVSIGPTSMKAIQGFNAGALNTTTVLMLFDWPNPNTFPPNGTNPQIAFLVPGQANFSDDNITSTKTFSRGLRWIASSTADTLTYDATQQIRFDAELYDQSQPTGTF
jgi:hypothetical protein